VHSHRHRRSIAKDTDFSQGCVEIGMGVVLIIVGFMLIFGVFNLLANYGLFIDFGL
jgi:hypothetical protein